MLYAVLIALLAWVGWWSIVQLPPNSVTLVLFFVLLFVAVGATLMPAIAYLNARFGRFRAKRVYVVRFVRQTLMVSGFVVIVAWLQLRDVLSPTLALIVMAVFVLTETFLVTRENPGEE